MPSAARNLKKMKVSVVLSLISYLVVPSVARVLGRCKVAKKLQDGGLSDFDGYSLENWVCLAYFESKFNPTAVYDTMHGDYTGYGLFQIRNNNWCDHGKNLCHTSCSALLNPDLKKTIECAKKIVQGKDGMGAWIIFVDCVMPTDLDVIQDYGHMIQNMWSKTMTPEPATRSLKALLDPELPEL